jgi:predicted Zn-dependent peptidase
MERPIEFYTLPNGIRVLHIYDDSPVAYCGIGIHAGTRDEVDDSQSGMAHFIEHCVFKGTQRRKSWNILNRLEDVGGDTNAYTEKEETFVYATVLDEFYERAMDLCTDIVLHPTFPQKELDHEKEVIIDEINSYNDSPSELIYDDFESLVFNNVGLGRNILGKEEVLSHYTTDDALRYYTARYGTNQMIFFSMGRMTQKMLHRLDDKYQPLTATQLLKAKRQLLGQLAIADEGKENLALNIAKTFLYFGRYNTLEQRAALINPITSSQLMEVANEVLTEDSLSEIIYE